MSATRRAISLIIFLKGSHLSSITYTHTHTHTHTHGERERERVMHCNPFACRNFMLRFWASTRTINYASCGLHIQCVLIAHHQYSMCTPCALLLCMHPSIMHGVHIHHARNALPYYVCSTSSIPHSSNIQCVHSTHRYLPCTISHAPCSAKI
jgi:hypothetical protein